MGRLKLFIAASLDAYIARPDGSVDWLFTDGDYGYREFYDSIDTVLMGRKTYQQTLDFGDYPYTGKESFVFTRQNFSSHDENISFVSRDIVGFTESLLRKRNDVWLVGGSEIIKLFLEHDLIDDIIVSIHPIILGSGIPLFGQIKKEVRMELADHVNFESGLVQLHYTISK